MLKQFLNNKKNKKNPYEILVVKNEKLNLKKLIDIVRENLTTWKNDEKLNDEMIKNLKYAIEGDLRYKNIIIKEIENFLIQTQKQINKKNIDILIKQYHINYYDNLYGEYDKNNPNEVKIYNYFNKFVISENSPIEKKYKKLAQIIYQENYGLSVIDEIADDINEINGIWTNSPTDIRIQYKGLKRKIKKLYFENQNKYIQTIANATSYDAEGDIGKDNPIILCSRRNGSRVTIIFTPITDTPYINIRNFNNNIATKEDILRERTHNEVIMKFNELIFKGLPNFSIIGVMGAGKTTYLRSLISEYDDNLGILTIEPTNELRLKDYYPNKDVRKHIYNRKFTPSDLLEISFREDRDIILQGEIRTPDEAYIDIYVKQRIARGSGNTYHAGGFEEFMITMRNLLMQTGLYKDYKIAEIDVAISNDLLYQLLYDEYTGRRYVNKISEIEIVDKINLKYKERVIFKYNKRKDDWEVKNIISDKLIKKLKQKSTFTEEIEKELLDLLKTNKVD